MKTVTRTEVDFSEIFQFAEKEYGIHWNPCNDLFFNTDIIRYNRNTEIWLDEAKAEFEEDEDTNYKKAHEIIVAFMEKNNLTKMMVLCD